MTFFSPDSSEAFVIPRSVDVSLEGVLSQSVVSYLHNDKYVNLRTIDKICQLLDCKIEDVVEILPDKSEK